MTTFWLGQLESKSLIRTMETYEKATIKSRRVMISMENMQEAVEVFSLCSSHQPTTADNARETHLQSADFRKTFHSIQPWREVLKMLTAAKPWHEPNKNV